MGCGSSCRLRGARVAAAPEADRAREARPFLGSYLEPPSASERTKYGKPTEARPCGNLNAEADPWPAAPDAERRGEQVCVGVSSQAEVSSAGGQAENVTVSPTPISLGCHDDSATVSLGGECSSVQLDDSRAHDFDPDSPTVFENTSVDLRVVGACSGELLFCMTIDGKATFGDLKLDIQRERGMPAWSQTLLAESTVLKDEDTIDAVFDGSRDDNFVAITISDSIDLPLVDWVWEAGEGVTFPASDGEPLRIESNNIWSDDDNLTLGEEEFNVTAEVSTDRADCTEIISFQQDSIHKKRACPNYIESRQTFRRPLRVTAEIKTDHEDCVDMVLFQPDGVGGRMFFEHSFHLSGSFGAKLLSGDAELSSEYSQLSHGWRKCEVEVLDDGTLEFVDEGHLVACVPTAAPVEGRVMFVSGMAGMSLRNIRVTPLGFGHVSALNSELL
mmetsp:Transcript_75939/g.210845  ORF Transcript_75939/g.210845 Transcript_75939/m.210845 type:complete len:445 (-) Transcript_75939:88-1422(-)